MIPVPRVSATKNVADLNTAGILQDFKDIRGGLYGYFEMPRVGLAYLPPQGAQTSGKLYFSWAEHLDDWTAYYQVNGSTVISLKGISSFSAGVGAGLVMPGAPDPVQLDMAGAKASGQPPATADQPLGLLVDLGEPELRQLVAGIGERYEAAALVGRQIVVVANLKPAKLMGVESRGMLLAASVGGDPFLLGQLPPVLVDLASEVLQRPLHGLGGLGHAPARQGGRARVLPDVRRQVLGLFDRLQE